MNSLGATTIQTISFLATCFLSLHVVTEAAESEVSISVARVEGSGIRVHSVKSPYQAGTTEIKVLLPERRGCGRRHVVLYVLPVEAGSGNRWGSGLLELQKLDVHNKHQLICVAPTFSHLPWYCDHPSDATIRQETYLVDVVVPFIDRSYPAIAGPRGRLLLGFSKSGWGACSLLLRHPDLFGKAAAWDSPLMMREPNRFGMEPIFGTQENFERYRISCLLTRETGGLLHGSRLLLLGYGNFRDHHQRAHALLSELAIPHVYRDGPQRPHHWSSGWLEEAVKELTAVSPDD